MTIDQLRYFLETARFQHLGKAAKSLRISPSAISTAIAGLEDELGCSLFDREGKRIRLSERGGYLKAQTERLLDLIEEMRMGMGSDDSSLSGNYRLAASHSLSRVLGPTWIRLSSRSQQLSAELCSMATGQAVREVLAGELDGSLCFSPLRHPDLKEHLLHRGNLVLVVRNGHPILKKSATDRLRALSKYPATLHKAVPGVEMCEDHPMFEKFGITPRVECLWDNDEYALEIVAQTDSWTLVPDVVLELASQTLKAVPLPSQWNAPYHVSWVVRDNRSGNIVLNRLREELETSFR